MKKKLMAILLMVVLAFSLCACEQEETPYRPTIYTPPDYKAMHEEAKIDWEYDRDLYSFEKLLVPYQPVWFLYDEEDSTLSKFELFQKYNPKYEGTEQDLIEDLKYFDHFYCSDSMIMINVDPAYKDKDIIALLPDIKAVKVLVRTYPIRDYYLEIETGLTNIIDAVKILDKVWFVKEVIIAYYGHMNV